MCGPAGFAAKNVSNEEGQGATQTYRPAGFVAQDRMVLEVKGVEVKGEPVLLRDWLYGKNKLIEQIKKKTEDY